MEVKYIELRGEKHPLCYNLYAIERICDEFGDIDTMIESMNGKDNVRSIGKMLKILMEAGREYCREMGMEMPKPIANPSALIDIRDPETIRAIFSTINDHSERSVEVTGKNAVPTQEN